MSKKTDHKSIREFMSRESSGKGNAGRKMKYDPKSKRFVVVSENDKDGDNLPEVPPEDLQSF